MYGLYKAIRANIWQNNNYIAKIIKSKSDGFALLEVMIALIIFGIISSLSISLLRNYSYKAKDQQTANNIEQIHMAITRYVKRFKKLPCPSHIKNNQQTNGFALVKCFTVNDSIGIVPYKSLSLPEKVAKDGYGNYFTYVVDPDLTNDDTLKSNKDDDRENNITNLPADGFGDDNFMDISSPSNQNTMDSYPGKIRITDRYQTAVIDYNNDKIAYIIIKDINLRSSDGELSPQEMINKQKSWEFYDLPQSQNKNYRFRQQLSWVSLHNLVDKIQRIF